MRSQTHRSPKFQQYEAKYTLGAILLGIPHDVEYQLYPLKKVNGKTLIPEIIGNSTLIALLLECKLLSFKKDLFSILNKMEGLTNIVATSKINDGSVKVIINVKQIRVHGKRAGRHVFVKMICSNNCSFFPFSPSLISSLGKCCHIHHLNLYLYLHLPQPLPLHQLIHLCLHSIVINILSYQSLGSEPTSLPIGWQQWK